MKGRRAVRADTAMSRARYFGTTAEFLPNLQGMHDPTKATAAGHVNGPEVSPAHGVARQPGPHLRRRRYLTPRI
jgi:plasmid maintenance system antidote protein VapI